MGRRKETKDDIVKKYFKNNKIVFFDVGARNGIFELPLIAPFIDVYGFEPNPLEYGKLINGISDLAKACNLVQPAYSSIRYFDIALHNSNGKADFFITENPKACSLMEPDLERISTFHHSKDKLLLPQFQVKKKEEVKVSTLDEFITTNCIDRIDYLKLDTQGNEYQILEGAKKLLTESKISVIKCEVEFQTLYKNQALFSDIDIFLRKAGFMLIDIRNAHKLAKTEERFSGDRDVLSSADAFYCLDMSKTDNFQRISEDTALKAGLVLLNLDYISLGLDIMKKLGKVDKKFLETILKFYCPEYATKRRILRMAEKYMPPFILPILLKGYHRFFKNKWKPISIKK